MCEASNCASERLFDIEEGGGADMAQYEAGALTFSDNSEFKNEWTLDSPRDAADEFWELETD